MALSRCSAREEREGAGLQEELKAARAAEEKAKNTTRADLAALIGTDEWQQKGGGRGWKGSGKGKNQTKGAGAGDQGGHRKGGGRDRKGGGGGGGGKGGGKGGKARGRGK